MMDQARQVMNQYIPATQWAMNYLNNGVKDFTTGFNGKPGEGSASNNMLQGLGDFTANATPTGQEAHLLPLALGVGEGVNKFGNALRNAIPKAYSQPIDNEAFHYIAPALQRMLDTHTPADPNYFINQMPADHGRIASMAETYMPGVTKILKNDPVKIAQALLERIRLDKYGK